MAVIATSSLRPMGASDLTFRSHESLSSGP